MARSFHTAWTLPSLPDSIVLLGGYSGSTAIEHYSDPTRLTAETVPGIKSRNSIFESFFTGGASFDLRHSGERACGIPEAGDTILMIGGFPSHKYVTRWVGGKIIIIIIIIIVIIIIIIIIMIKMIGWQNHKCGQLPH